MSKILKEFERWLVGKKYYGEEEAKDLLYKEWDGAFPNPSDDLILDIEKFLHAMAEFAVEKVFGENACWKISPLNFIIVPLGSYEDASQVFIIEKNTRTLVASLYRKTWHFDPETIEGDIKDLIEQAEETKNLLSVRLITSS